MNQNMNICVKYLVISFADQLFNIYMFNRFFETRDIL